MSTQSYRFGEYDVTILLDGTFEGPSDLITHRDGETARTEAIARFGQPKISIDVNCFLLRGANGVTLVDAGTGSAWGPGLGHARAALAAAGIGTEQVERVLMTHLHGDHALGLFDGEEPWLPKAEIIVPQADLAYYSDEARRAATPKARQGGFDIAVTLQRLYGGRIRTVGPGTVLPGIELLPLPGHSFGHSGYLIGEGEPALLIWGDALHLSGLQAADPDIGLIFDLDAAQAAGTRRDILDRAATAGWTVAGGHIHRFNRVSRKGAGYELTPAG